MKYVMIETSDGRKLPIIFPECLTHAHVAGAIQQAILAGGLEVKDRYDQQFSERQCDARLEEARHGLRGCPPISAGFVQISQASVSGKSESLGDLPSQPVDEARIVLGQGIEYMPDALALTTLQLYNYKESTT